MLLTDVGYGTGRIGTIDFNNKQSVQNIAIALFNLQEMECVITGQDLRRLLWLFVRGFTVGMLIAVLDEVIKLREDKNKG